MPGPPNDGPFPARRATALGARAMPPEPIAIIGTAPALAAAILPGQYAMRRDIDRVAAPRGTP